MDIKRKSIWSLLTLMVTAMVSLSLFSCGDDDDEESGIVGTWVSNHSTLTLGSDGSYYEHDNDYDQFRKGSYSYNPKQQLMVVDIVAVPGRNGAYQDTFIVQTLTSTTLVLLGTDGGVHGYYTRK